MINIFFFIRSFVRSLLWFVIDKALCSNVYDFYRKLCALNVKRKKNNFSKAKQTIKSSSSKMKL